MITLKTLHLATSQEVFDQVKEHLLKQGRKARNGDRCRYLAINGDKCAAGCLIAEDEYNSEFEGCSWGELVSRFSISGEHVHLICLLQEIHDDIMVEMWDDMLQEVAKNFNLKYE